MDRPTLTRAPLVSAFVALLASGTTVATAAADPTGDAAASRLLEALDFAPAGTDFITFTDGDAIKASHELEILVSSIPEALRVGGMVQITHDEAVFAGRAPEHMIGHFEARGWDASRMVR